ncbi:hypothetical protein ACV3RS_16770 [Clostridium perfringens]
MIELISILIFLGTVTRITVGNNNFAIKMILVMVISMNINR